jgi:hypothetical protein
MMTAIHLAEKKRRSEADLADASERTKPRVPDNVEDIEEMPNHPEIVRDKTILVRRKGEDVFKVFHLPTHAHWRQPHLYAGVYTRPRLGAWQYCLDHDDREAEWFTPLPKEYGWTWKRCKMKEPVAPQRDTPAEAPQRDTPAEAPQCDTPAAAVPAPLSKKRRKSARGRVPKRNR